MNDFIRHIAEVEGVRTPTKERTQEEIEASYKHWTDEREAKKAARKAKAAKASKPTSTASGSDRGTSAKSKSAKAGKSARSKKSAETPTPTPTPTPAAETVTVERFAIAVNPGHTTSAGYDPTARLMHVEFSKGNVYEYPDTPQKDWDDWQVTFDNAEINSGNYFRKAFRKRTYVRVTNPTAVTEVKA